MAAARKSMFILLASASIAYSIVRVGRHLWKRSLLHIEEEEEEEEGEKESHDYDKQIEDANSKHIDYDESSSMCEQLCEQDAHASEREKKKEDLIMTKVQEDDHNEFRVVINNNGEVIPASDFSAEGDQITSNDDNYLSMKKLNLINGSSTTYEKTKHDTDMYDTPNRRILATVPSDPVISLHHDKPYRSGIRTTCVPNVLSPNDCKSSAKMADTLLTYLRREGKYGSEADCCDSRERIISHKSRLRYKREGFGECITYISKDDDNTTTTTAFATATDTSLRKIDVELTWMMQNKFENILSNLTSRGLLYTKKQRCHNRTSYVFKIISRLPSPVSSSSPSPSPSPFFSSSEPPNGDGVIMSEIKIPEAFTSSTSHYCIIPLKGDLELLVKASENDGHAKGKSTCLGRGSVLKVSDGYHCSIRVPSSPSHCDWMWILILSCQESSKHSFAANEAASTGNGSLRHAGEGFGKGNNNDFSSRLRPSIDIEGTDTSVYSPEIRLSPSKNEIRKERKKEKRKLFKQAKRESEREKLSLRPTPEELERQRLERLREHKSIAVDLKTFEETHRQQTLLSLEESYVLSLEDDVKRTFDISDEEDKRRRSECDVMNTDTYYANPIITPAVEKMHVHSVYDTIAEHWHGTRYKAWPKVAQFIGSLSDYSLIADIGCGNGKNIGACNASGFCIGSDISLPLCEICASLQFEAMAADCITLPYRTGQFDAVLSIAVMHHLSTEARRLRCLEEAGRILKIGGRMLIYAWAYEQHESKSQHKFASQDVLVPWHLRVDTTPKNQKKNEPNLNTKTTTTTDNQQEEMYMSPPPPPSSSSPSSSSSSPSSYSPLSNVNGRKEIAFDSIERRHKTQQQQGPTVINGNGHHAIMATTPTDINVNSSKEPVFQRYCHVYTNGELEGLIHKVAGGTLFQIESSYYDTGNWCVICTKKG